MFTPSKITCLTAAVGAMLTIPLASAAEINQTANSSNPSFWNSSGIWGGAAPTTGNDYRSVVGPSGSTNIYTVNGTVWNQASWTVQNVDASNVTTASTSNTFGGDSLILSERAPLQWRSTGGSTQTANIVFDGGFIRGSVLTGAAEGLRSSTMAGTVSFATPTTAAAIGILSPTNNATFTFTINSTITGAAGNLLQLTMGGAGSNTRNVEFNVTGDLSSYFGTIYAGVATSMFGGTGVSAASFFSITSDAVGATVQLDTTDANFRYNMAGADVTFGSLLYGNGAGTTIANGVYDADDLNLLTGTTAFFGAGTITVVPEPATTAIAALGALGLVLATRVRQRRRAA